MSDITIFCVKTRGVAFFQLKKHGALVISTLFVFGVSLSLLYPFPTGPPDNGDFARIFASFSSGPVGLDFRPTPQNQEAYQKRFFNFYHRFWQLNNGRPGFAQTVSSSHPLFWPGRFCNLTPGIFDLAWNTFLLVFITGCILFVSLRNTAGYSSFFSVTAVTVIFADVNIVGYVNSFYQESGALLSFIVLIYSLHNLWIRRTAVSLAMVCASALMLIGSKVAYSSSVLPAVFPLWVGVALCTERNRRLRPYVIAAVLLLSFGSMLFIKHLVAVTLDERRANCYHFIFAGVIRFLPPDSSKNYLEEIGLDPSLVSLKGKSAYDPDGRFEMLSSALNTRLHVKALTRLAFHYPETFIEMMKFGLSTLGYYPPLLFPSFSDPHGIKPRFRWSLWSKLHNYFLNGIFYFTLVLGLTLVLMIYVWKEKYFEWPLFYLLTAVGFLLACFIQVVNSIMGDGPPAIVKHNFFANLLLDSALVFTFCGLIVTGITLWGKKADRNPPFQSEISNP
jgi:hypothetical protein